MSAPQMYGWKLQGDVKVLKAKIMAADNSRGSFAARHNVCREAGISGTAPSMLQLSGIKKNVITNKVNYLFGKSDNSTTHPRAPPIMSGTCLIASFENEQIIHAGRNNKVEEGDMVQLGKQGSRHILALVSRTDIVDTDSTEEDEKLRELREYHGVWAPVVGGSKITGSAPGHERSEEIVSEPTPSYLAFPGGPPAWPPAASTSCCSSDFADADTEPDTEPENESPRPRKRARVATTAARAATAGFYYEHPESDEDEDDGGSEYSSDSECSSCDDE